MKLIKYTVAGRQQYIVAESIQDALQFEHQVKFVEVLEDDVALTVKACRYFGAQVPPEKPPEPDRGPM